MVVFLFLFLFCFVFVCLGLFFFFNNFFFQAQMLSQIEREECQMGVGWGLVNFLMDGRPPAKKPCSLSGYLHHHNSKGGDTRTNNLTYSSV